MVRKKRRSATELVKEAMPMKSTKSWFGQLGATNRLYVRNVIDEVIANPGVSLVAVSQNLRIELQINRSVDTIAHTLREMIRDAQQKA